MSESEKLFTKIHGGMVSKKELLNVCEMLTNANDALQEKYYSLVNKYSKLLEFVKETDFIELPIEQLKTLAAYPDDSYLRKQAEYVLSLKELLKEIGEL